MKAYIISLLLFIAAAFTVNAQDKKPKNCEAFKEGHFVVKEGRYGNEYTIKRQGNYQVETDQYGAILTFKVNWTDQCSYMLTLEEIENLQKNPTNPDWKEGQIITVNILETTPKGYKQLSSSNFDNRTYMTDMIKVDPSTYNEIMADIGYENE